MNIYSIYLEKPNFENGVFSHSKNSKTINSCQGENNIFSWYKKKFFKDKKLEFYHSVNNIYNNPETKYLRSPIKIYEFKNFLFFLFYGFILILASIISLFLFKWKLALLSKELLSASIIKRSSKQFLFKKYFFDNFSWLFKPLWTYEVERKIQKL